MPTSILIAKFYHQLTAQLCHFRTEWFRVDVAHQLADVLFLPAQCAVCLDLSSFHDGFEQALIKRQTVQFGLFERNEFLAQFLQRQILAFSCAFAGL